MRKVSMDLSFRKESRRWPLPGSTSKALLRCISVFFDTRTRLQQCTNQSYLSVVHYRPHPKDDGRLCFHRRLSIHIFREGGTHPADGRYPIPGLDRGVPHPRCGWRVPHPADGGGGTLSEVMMGGYPIPGHDGGTPSQVWMWGVPPSRIRTGGTSGTSPSGDRSAKRALAMRQAVCLLRSRMTFLFLFLFLLRLTF